MPSSKSFDISHTELDMLDTKLANATSFVSKGGSTCKTYKTGAVQGTHEHNDAKFNPQISTNYTNYKSKIFFSSQL